MKRSTIREAVTWLVVGFVLAAILSAAGVPNLLIGAAGVALAVWGFRP